MEKGQIWSVALIALIVAVIASVVTASITGNSVRVRPAYGSGYDVYTTSETYSKLQIDAKLTTLLQRIEKLEAIVWGGGTVCSDSCMVLFKVVRISNQSNGYANDKVDFKDVKSGQIYTATITAEGQGTIIFAGKVYPLTYHGANYASEEDRTVIVDDQKLFSNSYFVLRESLSVTGTTCSDSCAKLFRVSAVVNRTTGYSSDYVKITDIKSAEQYTANVVGEGKASVVIKGLIYNVSYYGPSYVSEDDRYVLIENHYSYPSITYPKTFRGSYIVLG